MIKMNKIKRVLILGLLVLVLSVTSIFASTVSHPASQITSGTFSSGNFTFPDFLNITNRLGIGTSNPTHNLTVIGDANITGNFIGNVTTTNWFSGLFNWTILSSFLSFTGSVLDFDSSLLNATILSLDSNASTICSGSSVLLGNASCSDIYGVEWITPAQVDDIDDEDIETDLNTYVDIAGDTMTGNLTIGTTTTSNQISLLFQNEANNLQEILFREAAISNGNGFTLRYDGSLGVDLFHIIRHSANTTGKEALTIKRDNGFVGINTTSPTHELNVEGDVNVTGSITGDLNSSNGTLRYGYVPRLVTTADIVNATFDVYAAWQVDALDLSDIVPTGATAVHLGISVKGAATSDSFSIRRDATNSFNRILTHAVGTTDGFYNYATIAIDSDRLLDYRRCCNDLTYVDVTVLGWYI